MTTQKRISKPGLRRWAESQPATTVWDFYDNLGCPLACYLKSLGYTNVNAGGWTWGSRETDARNDIPQSIRDALGKATENTQTTAAGGLPITQPQLVLACS